MTDSVSQNPYAPPLSECGLPPRVRHTFCGLQPQWTRLDRFYKIYITEDAIYAGWIGGQFHDKLSVRYQLLALYFVLIGFVVAEPIALWIDHRRRRLQTLYDSLIADPNSFLAADRRNFMLPRKGIKSIAVSRRKTSWTFWVNSGVIELSPAGSDPVRIIVRDARNLDAIVAELDAAHYPVAFVA